MKRRTNPWPSFVELFSVLLIVTFAGFIMLSSAYEGELANFKKQEQEKKEFRERAMAVKKQVKEALAVGSARARDCGDDLCIDLYFHFKSKSDIIENPEERKVLSEACYQLKTALDTLPALQKKDLSLEVQGHTDKQRPPNLDTRENELYNWNLSGRRATSVLYQFRQCGLKEPEYKIVAVGYADSEPIPDCKDLPEKCDERNRRTTLRLHADTAQIEERLRRSGF